MPAHAFHKTAIEDCSQRRVTPARRTGYADSVTRLSRGSRRFVPCLAASTALLGACAPAAALAGRTDSAGAQRYTPAAHAADAGTCIDAPGSPLLEIANTTNARSRPLPPVTRPIAVLDTGVDPSVRELAGRVLPASNAVAGPATGLADDDGHGTQVAAAAAGAAGLVAGVSPTSPIMPIRIATASVPATPDSIVKGLTLAADRGARVAVLAVALPLSQVPDTSVRSIQLAINAAFDKGMITVVPGGDAGAEVQTFPAIAAHVLTVGSAGRLAVRDRFSNYGSWIDLVAPGADLVLPTPSGICAGGYARVSGTAFSAATVAGAVALLGATRSKLTTSQLYDLVRRWSSREVGDEGFDQQTGFGLLDVATGFGARAPRSDPHEINDNVYWLRRGPRAFPTYLRRTRQTTTHGAVSPGKDPQDAFRVRLRRNDVLRARFRNNDPKSVLYATVWSPRTAPFDMRLPGPRTLLRRVGFTPSPAVSYRARRTGTYYVAVFAPDRSIPLAGGGPGEGLLTLSPPHTEYRLTLEKRCSTTRTLRVPLAALRRPGRAMRKLVVYDNSVARARRGRSGIARRITLHGLRSGRHRIVFRASFSGRRRTSHVTLIGTRCRLGF